MDEESKIEAQDFYGLDESLGDPEIEGGPIKKITAKEIKGKIK